MHHKHGVIANETMIVALVTISYAPGADRARRRRERQRHPDPRDQRPVDRRLASARADSSREAARSI